MINVAVVGVQGRIQEFIGGALSVPSPMLPFSSLIHGLMHVVSIKYYSGRKIRTQIT